LDAGIAKRAISWVLQWSARNAKQKPKETSFFNTKSNLRVDSGLAYRLRIGLLKVTLKFLILAEISNMDSERTLIHPIKHEIRRRKREFR
jgi:hypothetical protein